MKKAVIEDHGVPAPADETRTAAVCTGKDGRARIVVAARGYLLVVDPASGASRQVMFPADNRDYPYNCLAARNGLFYTGAGKLFMALDPVAGEFVFTAAVEGGNAGFSFAEDGRGRICFTVQGSCALLRYDPGRGTLEDFGPVDENEQYPCSVAVDRQGWIYVGIGTERRDVVGFRPETGERRRFIPDRRRAVGAGYVYNGRDGGVYGHFDSRSHWAKDDPACRWYRFSAGVACPVPFSGVSPSLVSGYGFHRLHRQLQPPLRLERFDLAEREMEIADPGAPCGVKRLRLAYESAGAGLSALAAGPDGLVYGTSGHPLHLFRHDPRTGRTVDFGGAALDQGGGGNVCAWAVCGPGIYGAAYPEGFLHRVDTARPFDFKPGPARNPARVARVEEAYRPRCCLVHPDGERVLYGGFAGYGRVGGGLGLYNARTGESSAVPNADLVPDQSIVCLAASGGGKVYAGTSVLAPGGGRPRAVEAKLVQLDKSGRGVARAWSPLAGAREITALSADGERRLYLLTSDGMFAVFDPRAGRVTGTVDLSRFGGPARQAMVADPNAVPVVLMSRAVLRFDPARGTFARLAEPPAGREITAGGALTRGRLFFACGARLCSLRL